MNINIKPVSDLSDLIKIRNQYLDNCFESIELFLELQIRTGFGYMVYFKEREIGYFICGKDNTLLEYYLLPQYQKRADIIMKKVIKNLKIHSAYCHSFDFLMASCCMDFQKKVSSFGYLFRRYQKIVYEQRNFTTRIASTSDFDIIRNINEAVFENEEEIIDTIERENIRLFESNNHLIGFGIFQRIMPNRPEYDIGMLVIPEYRKQGWGTLIVQYLADDCIFNNFRPTCGCAIENWGSRKCLEKAGFTSEHRMLKFEF